MNVAVLYNEEDNEIKYIVNNFSEYYLNNTLRYSQKIKFLNKITIRTKYEICLIFADDIKEINEMINQNKINSKIIIFTRNLNSEYILKCIQITNDICYMKNNLENIFKKIFVVIDKYNLGKKDEKRKN